MTPGQRAALVYEIATQKDEDEMTDEDWCRDHYGHAERSWRE